MQIARLGFEHHTEWAGLLALCFERGVSEAESLLHWFHHLYTPIAFGVWVDGLLAGQYMALLRTLNLCGVPITVGMSVNMAIHPAYRGRGLIKHLANEVYAEVRASGALIGVGFSNAEGVQVDKHSKSYGYHLVGQMHPLLAITRPQHSKPKLKLELSPHFPLDVPIAPITAWEGIHFPKTAEYLYQRYACHPFRQYHFAIHREAGQIRGMIVYRHTRSLGVPSVALLEAYGDDLQGLFQAWGNQLWQQGIYGIQALSSPNSPLRTQLFRTLPSIRLPYARTPYYLTLKPLQNALPPELDHFNEWQLVGGDVL